MLKDKEKFYVGEIGNYYGGLGLKVENGKPYWSIENLDDDHWEEITKELYLALCKFEGVEP